MTTAGPIAAKTGPACTNLRAYGVLNEDLTAAKDPKRIFSYFRAKRAWLIIDKTGVIRYTRLDDPQGLVPSDEMLAIVEKYK